MNDIQLFYLHRTTHKPTGKMYHGIHRSSDINYGTEQWQDPYVGSGEKLMALGATRNDFVVTRLHAGSYEECKKLFDKIDIRYDHPLCLNSPVGALPGVPKSEHHKANIAKALAGKDGPMSDNTNIDGVPEHRCRWFNNGKYRVLLEVDDEDHNIPVNTDFKPEQWKPGKGKALGCMDVNSAPMMKVLLNADAMVETDGSDANEAGKSELNTSGQSNAHTVPQQPQQPPTKPAPKTAPARSTKQPTAKTKAATKTAD